MIDDPMAALQGSQPSWMGSNGLRGIVNVGWPTIRGSYVNGWRDRYTIKRPHGIIGEVDNRRPAPPQGVCPVAPIRATLEILVSGIVLCDPTIGVDPNGTFYLTWGTQFVGDVPHWLYNAPPAPGGETLNYDMYCGGMEISDGNNGYFDGGSFTAVGQIRTNNYECGFDPAIASGGTVQLISIN